MKTWITVRLESDGAITAEARGTADFTDSTGEVHSVTAGVPVEPSEAVKAALADVLTSGASVLASEVRRGVADTSKGVEDRIRKAGGGVLAAVGRLVMGG